MLARSAPFVASVPVLGLCLNLSAGCFVALGLLGMVATTKLTGLLYLVRIVHPCIASLIGRFCAVCRSWRPSVLTAHPAVVCVGSTWS